MAVALLFAPNFQVTNANGEPVSLAKIYSYQAGTLVPLSLWADPLGSTALPNPVTTDVGGRITAYATIGTALKLNALDANSVQIPGWPLDQYQVIAAGNPTLIDDYSATAAQSNLTHDPGEPGAEDLATSMAGELERLRFRLQEMTGGATWYATDAAKEKQGDVTQVGMGINLNWPPTGTSTLLFCLRIPYDWHSGGIDFALMRRVIAGSGTAIMPYTITRIRNSQAATTVSSGNVNLAAVDTLSHSTQLSVSAAAFAPGDWLKMAISRLGDDPGDGSCDVVYDGHIFAYTGYGAR